MNALRGLTFLTALFLIGFPIYVVLSGLAAAISENIVLGIISLVGVIQLFYVIQTKPSLGKSGPRFHNVLDFESEGSKKEPYFIGRRIAGVLCALLHLAFFAFLVYTKIESVKRGRPMHFINYRSVLITSGMAFSLLFILLTIRKK